MCFTDCPSEIEFAVNSGSPVDTVAVLTVGDVLSCSAEGASLYRWTNLHNDNNEETYVKTISYFSSLRHRPLLADTKLYCLVTEAEHPSGVISLTGKLTTSLVENNGSLTMSPAG